MLKRNINNTKNDTNKFNGLNLINNRHRPTKPIVSLVEDINPTKNDPIPHTDGAYNNDLCQKECLQWPDTISKKESTSDTITKNTHENIITFSSMLTDTVFRELGNQFHSNNNNSISNNKVNKHDFSSKHDKNIFTPSSQLNTNNNLHGASEHCFDELDNTDIYRSYTKIPQPNGTIDENVSALCTKDTIILDATPNMGLDPNRTFTNENVAKKFFHKSNSLLTPSHQKFYNYNDSKIKNKCNFDDKDIINNVNKPRLVKNSQQHSIYPTLISAGSKHTSKPTNKSHTLDRPRKIYNQKETIDPIFATLRSSLKQGNLYNKNIGSNSTQIKGNKSKVFVPKPPPDLGKNGAPSTITTSPLSIPSSSSTPNKSCYALKRIQELRILNSALENKLNDLTKAKCEEIAVLTSNHSIEKQALHHEYQSTIEDKDKQMYENQKKYDELKRNHFLVKRIDKRALNMLEEKVHNLNLTAEILRAESTNKNEEILRLQNENCDLAKKLNDLEYQTNKELTVVKEEHEQNLIELNNSHHKELENRDAKICATRQSCEKVKKRFHLLKVDYDSLKRQITSLEQKEADVLKDFSSLNDILEMKNNEIRTLKVQNLEFQNKIEDLLLMKKKLELLNREIEHQSFVIQEKDETEKKLFREKAKLEREVHYHKIVRKKLTFEKLVLSSQLNASNSKNFYDDNNHDTMTFNTFHDKTINRANNDPKSKNVQSSKQTLSPVCNNHHFPAFCSPVNPDRSLEAIKMIHFTRDLSACNDSLENYFSPNCSFAEDPSNMLASLCQTPFGIGNIPTHSSPKLSHSLSYPSLFDDTVTFGITP